jgi:hypothetical protein
MNVNQSQIPHHVARDWDFTLRLIQLWNLKSSSECLLAPPPLTADGPLPLVSRERFGAKRQNIG